MSFFISKKKKFSFYYANKSFTIETIDCSFIRKGLGLMFRTNETMSLLFTFSRDINRSLTSWFVFFPFLAIWLDSDDKIIEFRIVKPFTSYINIDKIFRKVLELPLNRDNMRVVRFLVGKGKV